MAIAVETDYSGDDKGKSTSYWSLERLKRSYLDYLGAKSSEIDEQKDARRYRHGSQYTQEQIAIYNRRHQPVVTFNHIGPKINGVIGLIERLKQSPKGYPRTPKEEEGAAVATAAVRYVLDAANWKKLAALCGEDASVDGFGGVELLIDAGDQGDPDITFERVQPDSFFYDPRSYELDFSDCRFLGQAKWLDLDQAKDMFPDQADQLEDAVESATQLSTNADREEKWFVSDINTKRVRVVDEWYRVGGEWYYCIYTGNMKLKEGKSYLTDEKKRTVCKYLMYSAAVDQDGDRYGFVRQFKSPQDEINQRRSKGLHLLNTRRLISEKGAFDDLEKTRIEATRPDGVVEYNKGFEANFDDEVRLKESEGQIRFLQEAKAELDSYGPTLSLIGDTGVQLSGRAISLQQQAGVAQLGPFILSNRAWKLRVYRAVWNAVRQYWKAERWIRVTDDENSIQFLGLNQLGTNPMNGMPAMVNHVSSLDVDIIMDEGPDSINVMQDTYDAMVAIVQAGGQVPPDIIIELAPGIDPDTRRRLLERLRQPDPAQEQAKQIELQQGTADVEKTQAETMATKVEAMLKAQEQPEGQDSGADDAAKLLEAQRDHILETQKHEQEMQMAREKHQQELELQREKARQDAEDRRMKMAEFNMKMQMNQANLQATKTKTEMEAESHAEKMGKYVPKQEDEIKQNFIQLSAGITESVRALQDLNAALAEMKADLAAPAEIVRDAKGRAQGVRKGKRNMTIKRDGAGRATGIE